MEAIAPTREWQRKFRHTAPRLDQKTNRTAYRRLSLAEDARRRDDLTDEQFRASEKLLKHWLGSQGVRVRETDDVQINTDTEYPRTYHAQKLAEAERVVRSPKTWDMMISLIAETKTLVEMGSAIGRTSHPVARAYALGKVTSGLDVLVDHWGLSTISRQKAP